MKLLVTYSASHRARLLKHPEPANRIARLVQDIFPSLRQLLDGPGKDIGSPALATTLLLTSLEITSPATFGLSVPWQSHLWVARRMITARQSTGTCLPISYTANREPDASCDMCVK